MSEYLVPVKYAKLLLLVAKEQGYDIDQLIEEAGLMFNPLDLNADNDFEVTSLVYSKLHQRISWLLQDEAFGLNGTFRMMCYCIIHCKTLKHSLDRAADFFTMCRSVTGKQSLAESPYVILPGGDEVLICYSNGEVNGNCPTDTSKPLRIINSLSLWHRFFCWLIGTDIELTQVHLAGPERVTPEAIQNYLNSPVAYNQSTYGLQFSTRYLDAPLVHTEESLNQFLLTAPYQLLASHSNEVVNQVKSIIGHNFTRKLPSFDEMASMLNTSSRTLRRRLAKVDASYQQIKDECRMDASKEYLSRPNMSINSVADLMGFDEPSAFHRSFKKWTNTTPGEYRRRISQATGSSVANELLL